MNYPKFDRENLNPALLTNEIGDAFQRFVYELLLPDYHDLHLFPSAGKDGGIDLSQTTAAARLVFECKHIGDGDLKTALSRWRKVADNLERNISNHASPKEAQYSPWYKTDPAISEYHFCVSAELRNQSQFDKLPAAISEFFKRLAARHPHLIHLAALTVKILDWSDLCRLLSRHPHLLFRWFPRTQPQGLLALDEGPDPGTFRSYLYSHTLPYYSRSQHLKIVPAEVAIADEEALLNSLEGDVVTGLVITGGGGIGKTRLGLELGRLAQAKGWMALKATTRLKESALEELAAELTPGAQVMILVDYIETQRDFSDLVDVLNDLNYRRNIHLRYVANCRTSYYQAVAGMARHLHLDLSPTGDSRAEHWLVTYRQSIVRYILEQSGIAVTDHHLTLCRAIPILAVFMSYLHKSTRAADLEELLREADFARWVAKRMQLSFGASEVSRELALLMGMLPAPDSTFEHPALGTQKFLLGKLATDHWIEQVNDSPEGMRWEAAHDVFADQLTLAHLFNVRYTVEHFVRELLSLGHAVGRLRAPLITFQRLVDQPVLSSVNWFTLLAAEIAKDPPAWREVRDILIRTSLLIPQERIRLLREYEAIWAGAETEPSFQNAIGWLARWAFKTDEPNLAPPDAEALTAWVKKAAAHASISNYILTYGLRFAPDAIREAALDWIKNRPTTFQTQYLLVAWLEQQLPLEDVAVAVFKWARRFCHEPHLTYVLQAWLNAGGAPRLVQGALQQWLARYGTELDAQYIYRAWLDARGDKELVRGALQEWLARYGAEVEAGFVYRGWLDAGGEIDVIQISLWVWFANHGDKPDSDYIYRAWLKAGGDVAAISGYVQTWLLTYGTEPRASFVYRSWLDAGGALQLVCAPLLEWLRQHGAEPQADYVYRGWLDAGGDKDSVQEPLLKWLAWHGAEPQADYVYCGWLNAGGEPPGVQGPLQAWLTRHGAEVNAQFVYTGWLGAGGEPWRVQGALRAWLTQYGMEFNAQLIYRAWLDAKGDTELLREPLQQWLARYGGESDARFIYRAWLDAKGDKELVREALQQWLERYGAEPEARSIYRSWLDAKGDKEIVCAPLLEWLRQHGSELDAQFVYCAWLNAGGDKGPIRELLLNWLIQHPVEIEARYIYRNWLLSGGDKELVREQMQQWLNANSNYRDAGFVSSAWLQARGDISLLTAHLVVWLGEFSRLDEARFVYKSWLEAGGSKELLGGSIAAWLSEHGTELNASWIYQPWLSAGGDKELIAQLLITWLRLHGTQLQAEFVYRAWLKTGGDKEVVRTGLTAWLVKHAKNKDVVTRLLEAWCKAGGDRELIDNIIRALYLAPERAVDIAVILQAWLSTGGASEAVKEPMLGWLQTYGTAREAADVYLTWLEKGGEIEIVSTLAVDWLRQNWQLSQALRLIKCVSEQASHDRELIGAILGLCRTMPAASNSLFAFVLLTPHFAQLPADEVVQTAEAVLTLLCRYPGDMVDRARTAITELTLSLVADANERFSAYRSQVDELFLAWLRHPASFGGALRLDAVFHQVAFGQRVLALIRADKLSPATDGEAIARFIDWVATWEPEQQSELLLEFDSVKT